MREILLYFSLKYHGSWEKIYSAILNKEEVNYEEARKVFESYKGSNFITILDENFPDYLKNINSPPFVLFYKGDLNILNDPKRIAVIGSRECSNYGIRACKELVEELVENNFTIISGLAKGIDKQAHLSALEKQGHTIAVMPCGLNNRYPISNSLLFDEIINLGGLVISEYPDDVLATKDKFGIRNRLISGLASKVLVIEAKSKSGTLVTVTHALYQNRDVYCVPNTIYSDSICNNLIKQGAKLVENVEDIIEDF